jgi:hypothetical protein
MKISLFAPLALIVAAPICCGTSAHGEDGWDLLREDGRVACFMKQGRAVPGSTEARVVKLMQIFKRIPDGRNHTGDTVETDCSGKPLPHQESYSMGYSFDTVEIDCRKGLYRFTEIIIHDQDGNIIRRYHLNDRPCPVPPASYLDMARSRACR